MENEEVLPDGGERLVMQLFVSGMSPKSMEAIENAKHLFGEDPGHRFQLEIIDLYKHPEAAQWLALGEEVDLVLDDTLIQVRG